MQNQYKCIIALAMIYMSVMIGSDLLVNKPVSMFFGHTTAATLVFPIWFLLNDIIAEVYGYRVCWRIIWTGFTVQLFFNLICNWAIHLPSPIDWHQQAAFDYIIGPLLRIAFSTLVIFLISGFINIRLLIKWKVLMSGKHFWLRSIGSSIIGEAIYSGLNVWLILLGSMSISKILMIMFWSFSIKIIYTILMVYPAAIVVHILKKIESIDVYDYDVCLNPFKKIHETLSQRPNLG